MSEKEGELARLCFEEFKRVASSGKSFCHWKNCQRIASEQVEFYGVLHPVCDEHYDEFKIRVKQGFSSL
jgi:hypothetical protein